MLGLSIYWLFAPPPGFDDSIGHRLTIPLVLLSCALMIYESLRTRTHIGQLVGAIRGITGRAGAPPTADAKREAVEILLKSLRSETGSVRRTAAKQLQLLTGQDHGDNVTDWETWWADNRNSFGAE